MTGAGSSPLGACCERRRRGDTSEYAYRNVVRCVHCDAVLRPVVPVKGIKP